MISKPMRAAGLEIQLHQEVVYDSLEAPVKNGVVGTDARIVETQSVSPLNPTCQCPRQAVQYGRSHAAAVGKFVSLLPKTELR